LRDQASDDEAKKIFEKYVSKANGSV